MMEPHAFIWIIALHSPFILAEIIRELESLRYHLLEGEVSPLYSYLNTYMHALRLSPVRKYLISLMILLELRSILDL